MFKTSGRMLLSLLIINKYYNPKMFYYEFYKSFRKGCWLLFSLFTKLCQTAADGCFVIDSNGIQTNNHLVRKRTLSNLAKLTK